MSKLKLFTSLFFISSVFPLTIWAAGLIPCGGPGQPACTFCDLFVLLDNMIQFVLLSVVPPIAVLMLVIGGIMFFLAGENPGNVAQATRIIRYTLLGIVLLFSAWVIVNSFFSLIGVKGWTGLGEGGWSVIDCSIGGGGSTFSFSQPQSLTVRQGEDFRLDFGIAPDRPLSQTTLAFNFDPNLLTLKAVIPSPVSSNFKTFLPIDTLGEFDEIRVKSEANTSGKIEIGATTFDVATLNFLPSQSESVDSLVTLVFEAKAPGTTEISLDSTNSQMVAAVGELLNILRQGDRNIRVQINE